MTYEVNFEIYLEKLDRLSFQKIIVEFLDRTLHDFFLQSVYSNRAYNSKRRFSVVRTKRIPAKPGLEQTFLSIHY